MFSMGELIPPDMCASIYHIHLLPLLPVQHNLKKGPLPLVYSLVCSQTLGRDPFLQNKHFLNEWIFYFNLLIRGEERAFSPVDSYTHRIHRYIY